MAVKVVSSLFCIFFVAINLRLVPVAPAQTLNKVEIVEYEIRNEQVKIAWDEGNPLDPADYYDLEMIAQDSVPPRVYARGKMTSTQYMVSWPRAGHFYFRIRACKGVECSSWAESTNATSSVVDGLSKAWRTFKILSSPGGGGVQ